METKMVEDIRKNWGNKSNEELCQIWKENNHERWSDSAFEAVKQILTERGVKLPLQDPPKELNAKVALLKSRYRTSARIFIVLVSIWWIFVIASLLSKPSLSSPSLVGAGIAFLASCFWFIELGRRELRQSALLALGLIITVGAFYGIFRAAVMIAQDGGSYALGSLIAPVILLILAYCLSFK